MSKWRGDPAAVRGRRGRRDLGKGLGREGPPEKRSRRDAGAGDRRGRRPGHWRPLQPSARLDETAEPAGALAAWGDEEDVVPREPGSGAASTRVALRPHATKRGCHVATRKRRGTPPALRSLDLTRHRRRRGERIDGAARTERAPRGRSSTRGLIGAVVLAGTLRSQAAPGRDCARGPAGTAIASDSGPSPPSVSGIEACKSRLDGSTRQSTSRGGSDEPPERVRRRRSRQEEGEYWEYRPRQRRERDESPAMPRGLPRGLLMSRHVIRSKIPGRERGGRGGHSRGYFPDGERAGPSSPSIGDRRTGS